MDGLQKLVVVKAAKKKLSDIERDLSRDVSEEMISKLPNGGTEHIWMNGEKVATYVVNAPTTKGGGKTAIVEVVNHANYSAWLLTCRKTYLCMFLEQEGLIERFAKYYLECTGEVPEGVDVRTIVEPVQISQGTSVRGVRFETVRDALAGQLPAALNLALEEGHD